MPVPTLVTDLSTTLASNSPAGSDNVFPDLDNYLRAMSGFIASIRDNSGNGWVSPYATAFNPNYTGTLTGGTGVVNLGSGQFYKSATGDVGVGTSSPLGKLHVNGNFLRIDQSGANQVFFGNAADLLSGAPAGGAIRYDGTALRFGAGSTQVAMFDSSGNLGIGTSSPGVKLDVVGAIRATTGMQNANGTSFYWGTGTTYVLGSSATNTINLGTNGVTQATLNSSGNLGLGTAPGSARFTIAGTAATTTQALLGSGSTTGAMYGRWSNTGSDLVWGAESSAGGTLLTGASAYAAVLYTNNAVPLQFGTGGTVKATIDASGNLGLGVAPSAWGTQWKAIQINTGASIYGSSTFTIVGQNVLGQTGTDNYISSAPATRYIQNSGAHIWNTAPSGTAGAAISFTQAMTLDASGNLGVGTTSPASFDSAWQRLVIGGGSGDVGQTIYSGSASIGTIAFADGTSGAQQYAGLIRYLHSSDAMTFWTNATERARITSGGDLLVGQTAGIDSERLCVEKDLNAAYLARFRNTNNTSPFGAFISYTAAAPNGTTNQFLRCDDNAATRAEIRSNGGLANYSGNNVNLSDRREKTNFAPAKDYLDTICAIPVQTFNYIDQSEDDPGLTLGVVAQDVQAVAPELVMESNWGTEDDPKMRLSIYQTDLQYALMKCIQEQQALITDLRARVAALEA